MTETDLLIHTSYVILIISFCLRDILWPRVLIAGGKFKIERGDMA